MNLDAVDIPASLKKFPYFMDWLKELNRSPEEVLNFAVQGETEEVEPVGEFRIFKQTDNFTASMTFKDKTWVERRGKWSEGLMIFSPESDESADEVTV